MDPLSQAVLGASASLSAAKQTHFRAMVCGFIAALTPDLDAFIRSDTDPLLYLEYHRHFTHSLIFIPLGGFICALLLHPLLMRDANFKQTYFYCTIGYATHGLLDACTTYGTLLLWPFSDHRIAWHAVSIIDPLFTVPLIILVLFGTYKKQRRFGLLALSWAFAYLSLGAIQGYRAESFAHQLITERGHQAKRIEAKPSFANILVWKIIYEADHRFYVDAVRIGIDTTFYPGTSINQLNIARDFPWLEQHSQQARDIERFRWFSNDYLAIDKQRENFIVDMRYSLVPNEVDGLWGIQLNPDRTADQHVDFIWDRQVTGTKRHRLMGMLLGTEKK